MGETIRRPPAACTSLTCWAFSTVPAPIKVLPLASRTAENALLPNYFTARRSAFDFTGSSTAPAFGNPEYAKGFIKRAVDWAIDAVRVRKQFPKIVLLVPLTTSGSMRRSARGT
mgnify:CR=1 FL=1